MSEFKKIKSISDVKTGSTIRHKTGTSLYVVISNHGVRLTAVKAIDILNSEEWEVQEEKNSLEETISEIKKLLNCHE